MPNWKKVIVSGSDAILNNITSSGGVSGSATSTASFGTYIGDGSQLSGISTTPFPFAGDGIISGSLLISSSNVGGVSTASLNLQGSGSTIFTIQGSQGNLFSVTDDLLHDNLVVNDISGDTLFKVSGSGLVTIPVGDLSGSGAATASYGHFIGDGGGLTNLNTTTPTLAQVVTAGATATGDVQITGSLIISQSYTAGDTDSTALRLLGSGSVSQSGIFEVEGSAGPLFSVADGLDGVLMEVNNISGLPLFQVSSSNEVFVNRGNLTSGVTTATASFANFSGSFQGDGSQLTNLPAATAGSTAGRVVFTTTGGALTTDSGFDYNSADDRLTVSNLTTTTFTASFITSSTIETSGSNIFGDEAGVDVQTLIGTTKMTGSAQITGSTSISGALAITGISDVSASIAAASSAFPFTGDAQITGSLTISGSLIPSTNPPNRQNIVIGQDAALGLVDNASFGITNVIVGYEAAHDANQLNNSVLLGWKAGYAIDNGTNNIGIGKSALGSTTSRGNSIRYNIGVGEGSGANLQGGTSGNYDEYNILMGIYSGANLYSNDGNYNNILIGHHNKGLPSSGTLRNSLKIGQTTSGNVTIFPISASLDSGSVLIPQLKVDSVNTANSASGTTLSVEGSGSTVFEVIGSEGTLFSVDDDLDGTIFTANDKSGLPVLEASASGEVYIGKSPQSLYTTAVISSTTAATTQSIFGLSTSSYGGAFFDYTVQSGSNARAGSIMSVWNGSNISFTETTTTDIGDTTDFNVIVHISQSQAQMASHATRAGYNIKTIIRSI